MTSGFGLDDWYPLTLSAAVGQEQAIPVLLFEQELVVWRAERGAVQVWEDRCIHRGTRLSLGFVRGNALHCLYHGWQYSAQGLCTRIPAHPGLVPPSGGRIRSFSCTERGGVIWGRLEAETAQIPEQTWTPFKSDALPVRSIACHRGADEVLDRLKKFEFPPFRAPAGAPIRYAPKRRGAVVSVDASYAGTENEVLHLAFQPACRDSTMLHVLVSVPGARNHESAVRHHYSRCMERFRCSVENEG